MKKIKLFIFLLASAGFVLQSHAQDVSMYGAAITADEGKTWITNYTRSFGAEQGITFTEKSMKELLTKSGVEGMYILRGLDSNNNEVLMLRSADKNGMIIYPEVILGPDGLFIPEERAFEMFKKFQSIHEDRTPGYLYGKQGFETILNQPHSEGIRFINGLDELSIEHLVFVGVNDKGEEQWTASIWNHGSGIFSFFGWGLYSRR